MRYTAIVFTVDPVSARSTVAMSCPVDADDVKEVYRIIKAEFHCVDEEINTILLMKSTTHYSGSMGAPEIIHNWSSDRGDFNF